MDSNEGVRPIIKRKKVVKGGGHHGGAWKVAYADFVTAMMAFFLLMWLLNATTEEQRKGIAAFFNPGVPVFSESGGGDGMFRGSSIISEIPDAQPRSSDSQETPDITHAAAGDTGETPAEPGAQAAGETDQRFTEIESLFRGDSGESTVEDPLLKHVHVRVTDEGLIIDVFDLPDSLLFVPGTDRPTRRFELLMQMVAEAIGLVSNPVAVSGHLGLTPEVAEQPDGFALSVGRARRAAALMIDTGLDPQRMLRLTGQSDRAPALPDGPDYRNRRVEITLLRTDLH